MRFSSAIVLAVAAAALISSISAKSLDDNAGICHRFCVLNENCVGCMTVLPFLLVSRVSAFTSVQYGRWH
ncbi:hypothetical protein P692DRAFT_20838070 [Suillus brevipes Sb2]|nr:hypothetical protein P692DRAFT_20838070 [Suillus brevipes Sb2]